MTVLFDLFNFSNRHLTDTLFSLGNGSIDKPVVQVWRIYKLLPELVLLLYGLFFISKNSLNSIMILLFQKRFSSHNVRSGGRPIGVTNPLYCFTYTTKKFLSSIGHHDKDYNTTREETESYVTTQLIEDLDQ